MELIKVIHYETTTSTNAMLRDYRGELGELMTIATADYQTAGRGQGGNTWESERSKNLLVSMMVHPDGLPAARQYALTEACALAVRDALSHYVDGLSIKWPNDVYLHDRKISGTLSECDINGGLVRRCIMGIGINVNQRTFGDGAPNATSLANATGADVSRSGVLERLTDAMRDYLRMVDGKRYDELHALYLDGLYRREGLHRYADDCGEFEAETVTVEPSGLLVLRRADGSVARYAFKEVRFIKDDT